MFVVELSLEAPPIEVADAPVPTRRIVRFVMPPEAEPDPECVLALSGARRVPSSDTYPAEEYETPAAVGLLAREEGVTVLILCSVELLPGSELKACLGLPV